MIRIYRLSLVSIFLSGAISPVCSIFGAAGTGVALPGIHAEILNSIIDLRFERADSLLDHCLELDINDAGTLYLQNYLEFLDAVISGDRQDFEQYLEASGSRIRTIRSGIKNDPGSLAVLSSIYLQSSFLRANHGETIRAARNFYSSHRYLRQSEERNPGSSGNYRIRGLITLVTASMPDDYHWLLKVFGMGGDTEEGFRYLQKYYNASRGPYRLEACLLLLYASHTIDPGNKNENVPASCGGDSCGGESITLCRYIRALEDLSLGNSRGVVANLLEYRQKTGEREFPYLDLLLGEAMLNNLDVGARVPLERFIRNHKGDSYIHYAWHKISWCYALNGEWDSYRDARQEALGSGEPYLDADRQALSEAIDTLPLNIFLLKARLLFDGGYYREALGQLADSSEVLLVNHRDSLEYTYRLARIHERLGDTVTAIAYYEEVIASGSGENWYFAPNAALHLGIIHENNGDTQKALEYYRECLKINNSAYERSIDYKARQGIRRLED